MKMTPSPVCRMFRALSNSGDIILVTLRMMLAQSQISTRGDRIPPQIWNLFITKGSYHQSPEAHRRC